jgi:hypothetical protein
VRKAARRIEKERKEQGKPLEKGGTLLPTTETTEAPGLGPQPDIDILPPPEEEAPREETDAEQQARVFAKLQEMGSGSKQED